MALLCQTVPPPLFTVYHLLGTITEKRQGSKGAQGRGLGTVKGLARGTESGYFEA